MPIVELHQLTKFYNNSRGIVDLTFSIEKGEIFGFIGPNGAGKSTTIRTLLNFIYPTSGSATIFGKDIVTHSKEIRREVGYLPAEVHFYDDMRVLDFLHYAAGFHRMNHRDRDRDQRIHELAKRLDLDLKRKIEDLSFGNRKKTGIVQALLHKPKLLILDEPTSGLDPLMQNIFFELLEEERQNGCTIFFSSHILSDVQKMCDRVAIIKEGRIVAIETIEHLTKNHFKRITLSFSKQERFDIDLEGMFNLESFHQGVTFLYKGDMKALLRSLVDVPFQNISIEEPSLDEIFMHFYEKGGDSS